jgi:signal transduction histidine kinase
MDTNQLLVAAYIAVITFNTGLFAVFFFQRNNSSERSWFSYFVLSISAWLFCMLLIISDFQLIDQIYLARAQNFFTALAALLFTKFISIAIEKEDKSNDKNIKNRILYTLSAFAAVASLTPLVISGLENDQSAIIPPPIYGPLIPIYAVIMGLVILNIVYVLIKARGRSNENGQLLRLISFGLIISSAVGLLTNLTLPLLTGNVELSTLGPLAMVIVTATVSFGIVRYQFLGTRIIFGRITYYVLVGLLPYTFFFMTAFVYTLIYGSVFDPRAFIFGAIPTIIFVILFNITNEYIKKQVRTKFINPGYDPYEVVDRISKKLSVSVELSEITKELSNVFSSTLRVSGTSIFVFAEKERDQLFFGPVTNAMDQGNRKTIEDINNLWTNKGVSNILLQDKELTKYNYSKDDQAKLTKIFHFMTQQNLSMITPLRSTDGLIGIAFIPSKEAKSPLTPQDTQLIENVLNTTSLAINRALLYEEVQQFNDSLQKKIKLATKELLDQNELLETALTRLEAIRQQEQDMLDVMGHELRTPITIIRNALGFLKLKTDAKREVTQEQIASYSEKGLEAARREIILIETLLAATKMEAKRVQLNLDAVNIIDVINIAIEAHQQIADERGIKVVFHQPKGEASDWQVYADRTRIQEIQDNLVSNAIKYTMKGTVEISVEKLKTKLKINVKDSGIGITKEDLAKLGRKFFRAKQYIKDGASGAVVRPGGTGLGLYVSFELVKLMGGRVTIESELGKGSTFSYTMPIYQGQEAKHIDQTFEKSQQDQTLDELTAKEGSRKTREIVKQILGREDVEVEKEEKSKDEIKGFRTISNTGEIISKITPKKQK